MHFRNCGNTTSVGFETRTSFVRYDGQKTELFSQRWLGFQAGTSSRSITTLKTSQFRPAQSISAPSTKHKSTSILRPIIMQLDLQSAVEKVPFSTFAWAFAPKMLEIGLRRPRMTWVFLQHLSRAVRRFFRGPVAGNHRQHVFDPTGPQSPIGSKKTFFSIRSEIVIVFDPLGCHRIGSKKCRRWFSATGPLEKLQTALDRSWRKSTPFWGEED